MKGFDEHKEPSDDDILRQRHGSAKPEDKYPIVIAPGILGMSDRRELNDMSKEEFRKEALDMISPEVYSMEFVDETFSKGPALWTGKGGVIIFVTEQMKLDNASQEDVDKRIAELEVELDDNLAYIIENGTFRKATDED